jgi:selenocysteine lyase/cysteine desulfurase
MIYLDCAATSLEKPVSVRYGMDFALQHLSSPGRGGYESAMAAADVVLDCRMALAELFHVPGPEQVIFTSSATHSLNIAIKSLVRPGDRVVVSGYEHNAVMRPLYALHADVQVASSPLFQPQQAVEAFSRALPGARAVICTAVSNVFGYILPIQEIGALCRAAGVPLIVDAAQAAGCMPLDFSALGCDFMAMPGHKGLLGPQGTGVLLCRNADVRTLLEGGTGSLSAQGAMPDFLPDRLEPGTHNVPGIAGLLAGARWVMDQGPENILRREQEIMGLFAGSMADIPGVKLYLAPAGNAQSGVLSVQAEGMDCEDVARGLGQQGIAVRAGLHCAPLAHQTAGTFQRGTVRFSFSPFVTPGQAEQAARVFRQLCAL